MTDINDDDTYFTENPRSYEQWIDQDPGRATVIQDVYWRMKEHLREASFDYEILDEMTVQEWIEVVIRHSSACPK